MAITRRQCQKQIVLVCFHDLSLLLQVNRVNAEGLLQESSPIATNLVYLPDSFQPLVHFLQHKAGRSYYQNIIKKALIKMSTNFSAGFDALCSNHFPMQCSVVDWCINLVINNYTSPAILRTEVSTSSFILRSDDKDGNKSLILDNKPL
jgi:hypothetical protein